MVSRTQRVVAVVALAIAAFGGSVSAACGDDPSIAPAPDEAGADSAAGTEAGDAERVVPKGARVLGIAMPASDLSFNDNVQTARDAGARATNVTLGWDEIERPYDAGAADAAEDAGEPADAGPPTQLFNASLHVANLILDEARMQALVAVAAIDVGGSRAPAELAARPLDDPELGARYDKLTDYVLRSVPDVDVAALLVGTEVDAPLGDDPAKHAAFATFVGRAAAHAHAARPGLKVGFTVTAEGIEAAAPRLAAAWAASDVIGVRYLAVDGAAHVRAPSAIGADLDRILAAAPAGKPIVLHEAGFPTAAACGADEASQAAFVRALFVAWDGRGERMPLLVFRELDDAPADTVTALAARHRRSDAPFLALLGSLGLRAPDGRRKQGWDALIREARARGF